MRLAIRFLSLFCAVSLLAACGEPSGPSGVGTGGAGGAGGDDPGPGGTGGGSGGSGGSGGEGGTGGSGPGGKPEVHGFEPEKGGPGFRIRVVGRNFNPTASKNAVLFSGSAGSPNIVSRGVAAASDGAWYEVDVPLNAKTGRTLVTVETAAGEVSLEGPVFEVTDERLPPILNSASPEVITAVDAKVRVTLTGAGFYPNVTTLTINDEPYPLDWGQSGQTLAHTVSFDFPAELARTPGTYALQLHTPPPGGGSSAVRAIKVVPGLNLLKAKATGQQRVRLFFDRPVSSSAANNWRNFSIVGRQNAVREARLVQGDGTQVDLTLNFTPPPNQTQRVRVSQSVTAFDGGEIQNREATFYGFGTLPLLLDEIGGPGCAADRFVDPVSVSIGQEGDLLVVDRGGNQVKVLDRDGNFLGFFGHDGATHGYFDVGITPDCAAVGGFDEPFGQVVETQAGLFVSDLAGRVWKITDQGWTELYSNALFTVLLGLARGQLAVTIGQGNIGLLRPSDGKPAGTIGESEPGKGPHQLLFVTTDEAIPAVLDHGGLVYVVDTGNHRVKQYSSALNALGSIGVGSKSFKERATGEPGTGQGEFTYPSGIAVDAFGGLYVSDTAGGVSGGGRIQRFATDGTFGWQFPLNYVPGGIAIDAEQDRLWVVNRTAKKLMLYELR